jgi:hypothetical protein
LKRAGAGAFTTAIAENGSQVVEEGSERPVRPPGALNVHLPNDVLGKLDSAEVRRVSRGQYCLGKTVLVKVSAALLIRCVTASANRPAECGAVQQQPAFDVRIGDGRDYWREKGGHRFSYIVNFAEAIVQSAAVGIGGDDNQVR